MSGQVIDAEVIDAEVISQPKSLAKSEHAPIDATLMRELGLMVPVADPVQLRAAFDQKQKLYAAILDPNDYLYTVSYLDGGKQRQFVSTSKEHAEKVATANGSNVHASPKKSGIVKLARALGIVARRVQGRGLPDDPNATFSYITYEATHEASGTTEQGIGWCDMSERGGRISKHDVIATADTRAYNRAVLRLSGFGDVSADEIIGSTAGEEAVPQFGAESKRLEPLPPAGSAEVVAAMRSWACAIADNGNTYSPAARQATLESRMLRARARRGDERSAHHLGGAGLRWDGKAQDASGSESFEVEPSSIKPEDILAEKKAQQDALEAGLKQEAAKPKPGLDLTGNGPEFNDVEPPWESDETAAVESIAPNPNAETITTSQAKKLSGAVVELMKGDKERARNWIMQHALVGRSTEVRTNQYEKLMSMIEKQKEAAGG